MSFPIIWRKLNLLLFLGVTFIVLLQLGCGDESSINEKEIWKGTSKEAEEHFEKNYDTDRTTILIKNGGRERFQGILEANDSNNILSQNYDNGKLNGQSSLISTNGSRVDANFKDGKLHGQMILRGSDGKVRSVIDYENGELIQNPD